MTQYAIGTDIVRHRKENWSDIQSVKNACISAMGKKLKIKEGEIKMAEVFESVTVTISKREYAELIRKAFAYDAYKRNVKENKAKGNYISSVESALFLTDDVIDVLDVMHGIEPNMDIEPLQEEVEKVEEIFTEEEWEKIVEMAEEGKENPAEEEENEEIEGSMNDGKAV